MNPLDIFGVIYQAIIEKKDQNAPFIVGINGIDTSGKTQFTLMLNDFLKSKGLKTLIIHLDDFHNPKVMRYAGDDQADNFYNKSFNINLLINELLKPIKARGRLFKKLIHLNLLTDRFEIEKEYHVDSDTVILFEGVFLFRKELLPYLDYKIFIDVPFEVVKERAKERDVPTQGKEVLKKYDEKYIPAQQKYLSQYPPEKIADLIIDNSDWKNPRIKYKVTI